MTDQLKKLEEAEQRIKELLVEARGMIKDIRAEKKSIEEFIKESIQDKIELEVETGLAEYKNVLEKSISLATDAVFRRFDALMHLLLGTDKQTKKENKETLEELLTRYLEQKAKE